MRPSRRLATPSASLGWRHWLPNSPRAAGPPAWTRREAGRRVCLPRTLSPAPPRYRSASTPIPGATGPGCTGGPGPTRSPPRLQTLPPSSYAFCGQLARHDWPAPLTGDRRSPGTSGHAAPDTRTGRTQFLIGDVPAPTIRHECSRPGVLAGSPSATPRLSCTWVSAGVPAAGAGLRLRDGLLAASAGLAQSRSLAAPARVAAGRAEHRWRAGLVPDGDRRLPCAGAPRRPETGPSPAIT